MNHLTEKYSITSYKVLSQALIQSLALTVINDTIGTIRSVNTKLCELTSCTFEERFEKYPCISKSELTLPDLLQQLRDRIFAGVYKKENGNLSYEYISVVPIVDDRENILGFMAVHDNIADREKKEIELNKCCTALTALIENTTDDIWIIDTNYKITVLNSNFQQNFKQAFGLTLQIGDNILAILDGISKELKEIWKSRFDKVLDGERLVEIEHCSYKGVAEYVEVNINPIRINGKVVGVSVVSRDITDRKKTELELLNSEKRFRQIATNIGDVIWIYSLSSNKFSYVSPSAARLGGYAPEDVLYRSVKDILTPASYQYVLEELPKRVADFNAGDMSTKIRTDNLDAVHKNGKVVNMEVVSTILADQNGKAASILGVSRDITQRKSVEESLRNANQELTLHIEAIEKLQDELQYRAITDSLTGLYNRHFMQEILKRETARARRKKQKLNLIMLDIDHFKEINDRYGHVAGDQILQELAKLLKACSREYDYVFRYGGDEFLIILSEIDSESINKFGERIRAEFESLEVSYKDYKIQSTLSVGILQTSSYANDLLIRSADKALYNAKQMGRNRVARHEEVG